MCSQAQEEARKFWERSGDEKPIPLWLDCDTGHDDAFAILLASQCPRLQLLGVSTVHGNASLENTTTNTQRVLKAVGREDVLVYPGAAKPFCREPVHAESIHGTSGLDGTDLLPALQPPTGLPRDCDNLAVESMYKALSRTVPGTAWLVATGALTNVALLFSLHPSLANHLAGLSIMGGAIGGFFTHAPLGRLPERIQLSPQLHQKFPSGLPDDSGMSIAEVAAHFRELGLLQNAEDISDDKVQFLLNQARRSFGNWTPFAEFNIYCDPEAASALLSNPQLARKTTLIPLDVTHQVLATPAILALVQHGHHPTPDPAPGDSKVRPLFHDLLTFFAQTYNTECSMPSPPLHDPLAVAAVLCPRLFSDNDGERYAVHVVRDGDDPVVPRSRTSSESVGQCGRTVARMVGRAGEGVEGVRIPRTLRVEVFWWLIEFALVEAERRTGMKGF